PRILAGGWVGDVQRDAAGRFVSCAAAADFTEGVRLGIALSADGRWELGVLRMPLELEHRSYRVLLRFGGRAWPVAAEGKGASLWMVLPAGPGRASRP